MRKNIYTIFLIYFFVATTPILGQKRLTDLENQLQSIICHKKAQIGIAVLLNGKDTVLVNNNIHYPMLSVYKFHQALAVAHQVERCGITLDHSILIDKSDLKTNTYSPLRDKYPQGNINMSLKELLTYTLQQSDNNACDILFKYIANTKNTDRYIRSLGLEQFSIFATEADMHDNVENCYQNWTTPLEVARLLNIFISDSIFNTANQTFLMKTMIECQTGKDRLAKPLLHSKAIIGHKTGTGDRNKNGQIIGFNDIGFVLLPDGSKYTIAIFIKDSEETEKNNSQIIAKLSEVVYNYIMNQL